MQVIKLKSGEQLGVVAIQATLDAIEGATFESALLWLALTDDRQVFWEVGPGDVQSTDSVKYTITDEGTLKLVVGGIPHVPVSAEASGTRSRKLVRCLRWHCCVEIVLLSRHSWEVSTS